MNATAIVLLGVFAWAMLVGFVVAVVVVGARKPRPKPPAPTGTLHERMVPRPRPVADPEWAYDFGPLASAGADRQAARLAAELDDDAAVDRWLTGGAS